MSALNELGSSELEFGLRQYLELSASTAIYPEDCTMTYPALGLADEVGEFFDKFMNWSPDRWNSEEEYNADIAKELGDICWYVSAVARDCKVGLLNMLPNDLDEIHDKAASITSELSPVYCLVVEASKICGYVKKIKRDKVDRRGQIGIALFNIILLISVISTYVETDIKTVMLSNTQKLLDRQQRGVLKGDGDNR